MGKRAPNARGRGRGAGQTSPTIKESESQICTSGGRGRGKKDASAVLCKWCKRFRFSPCPLSGKPIMWRSEAGAQCRVCARRIANSAQLRKEAQSGALEKTCNWFGLSGQVALGHPYRRNRVGGKERTGAAA